MTTDRGTNNKSKKELDSNMLKSKNQVTSAVTIVSMTYVLPKMNKVNRGLWAKVNIPLPDIHTSGPAILILYQW